MNNHFVCLLKKYQVPANFVPAAAVIRGGLVLFVMTGRKGYVGGQAKIKEKTEERPSLFFVYYLS